MSIRSIIVAAALGVATVSGAAYAQDGQGQNRQDNNGGDRGGDRGNRRNWDPAQMQQRMMEMMKDQLKVQDDEWKVIEPKLNKVMTATRDLRFNGGMGFGGRGGMGTGRDNNANADQPQSEIARASRELRTTLQNDSASATDIEAKLTAFRAAREKAQEELKTAREDLKGVLTQRQEAVLVMSGLLE